ncbi:MAG: DUF1294 domain-containing protein [Candidatus Moranbacteria bacterium]|nr:DUF1294 domain-containing protein [Candidatus Moranbacteria bacterium]NTW45527.1 DUF1294 domain-containing protein [Candidatus Moranbacteria bacterium]
MWMLIYAVLNAAAFFVMAADKARARGGESERISEGMMFFLAAAFGALGVFAGMFAFRHKTRKWYFLVGIPLVLFENLAALHLILTTLSGSDL